MSWARIVVVARHLCNYCCRHSCWRMRIYAVRLCADLLHTVWMYRLYCNTHLSASRGFGVPSIAVVVSAATLREWKSKYRVSCWHMIAASSNGSVVMSYNAFAVDAISEHKRRPTDAAKNWWHLRCTTPGWRPYWPRDVTRFSWENEISHIFLS